MTRSKPSPVGGLKNKMMFYCKADVSLSYALHGSLAERSLEATNTSNLSGGVMITDQ